MTLHWLRVRRARGERPTPIPKPKRPLGPPVLFVIDEFPIRLRSDAEEAYFSWDEFLDRVAQVGRCMLWDTTAVGQPVLFFHSVIRLVPEGERGDLLRDINRRVQTLEADLRRQTGELFQKSEYGAAKATADAIQRQSFFDRWLGRAA